MQELQMNNKFRHHFLSHISNVHKHTHRHTHTHTNLGCNINQNKKKIIIKSVSTTSKCLISKPDQIILWRFHSKNFLTQDLTSTRDIWYEHVGKFTVENNWTLRTTSNKPGLILTSYCIAEHSVWHYYACMYTEAERFHKNWRPCWPSGKGVRLDSSRPGFHLCHGSFSRSSHTSDIKTGAPVATLPDA